MTINEQKLALDTLWYELWMFNKIREHLVLLEKNKSIGVETNAYLESFLLHTRNIVDFLEDRKRDSDIKCSDFGIQKVSINLPPRNTLREINLWLAHITKERIKEENVRWEYLKIREEVNKWFRIFIIALSEDLFPTPKFKKTKNDFYSLMRKTLKFRESLVKSILSGKKDITWRLFDDKNLSVGNEIDLINWNNREKFGEAVITDIQEKKMGEIEEKDFDGHEKFSNKEEMFNTYRTYYGDKINTDTMVRIVRFKLK